MFLSRFALICIFSLSVASCLGGGGGGGGNSDGAQSPTVPSNTSTTAAKFGDVKFGQAKFQ